jgi:ATP-binding cassette subfamily B protein
MDRLNDVFLAVPDIQDRPGAADIPFTGKLTIRELSYAYPGTEKPALEIHSFDVPAGSTLGIIGLTGSGKSTLANLLLRAYDTAPDSLLLDGRPLSAYTLERLRSGMGYVSQEPFLFSATIRENMASFQTGWSDEDIRKAASDSCILESIDEMADGLDTLLGERGINLSGGQRQRVAIARALLRDTPVLIIDDALSAVDTITEARILENLAIRRKGKTTILISHRISAVAGADRILVLDGGHVAQSGSHEQLLREGGLYREIHDEQEEDRTRLIRGL